MTNPQVPRISLLAYSLIHGVIFWLAQKGKIWPLLPTLGILLICALSCTWVHLDARKNEHAPARWLLALSFLLPIVGVPIYLQKYRDENARRKSLRGFIGFIVLMFILYLIGTFVADFIN